MWCQHLAVVFFAAAASAHDSTKQARLASEMSAGLRNRSSAPKDLQHTQNQTTHRRFDGEPLPHNRTVKHAVQKKVNVSNRTSFLQYANTSKMHSIRNVSSMNTTFNHNVSTRHNTSKSRALVANYANKKTNQTQLSVPAKQAKVNKALSSGNRSARAHHLVAAAETHGIEHKPASKKVQVLMATKKGIARQPATLSSVPDFGNHRVARMLNHKPHGGSPPMEERRALRASMRSSEQDPAEEVKLVNPSAGLRARGVISVAAAPSPSDNGTGVESVAAKGSYRPSSVVEAVGTCSCQHKGVCSCQSTMEFMDCIANACSSGKCDCHELQFQHACVSMAAECPTLDMQCSKEKAFCLYERETELSFQPKPARNRTDDEIYDELRDLKERACRLELAADDGWLNAERQLQNVKPDIDRCMGELIERGVKLPEMHCEKHFEEWHYPATEEPQGGAAQCSVCMVTMLAVAASMAMLGL